MKRMQPSSRTQFDPSEVSVKRDVYRSKKKPTVSQSLTGKGEIGGSNNYAKMNYQNN